MFSSKKFDPTKDLPDLTGKVIIVTGAKCQSSFGVYLTKIDRIFLLIARGLAILLLNTLPDKVRRYIWVRVMRKEAPKLFPTLKTRVLVLGGLYGYVVI